MNFHFSSTPSVIAYTYEREVNLMRKWLSAFFLTAVLVSPLLLNANNESQDAPELCAGSNGALEQDIF